MDIGTTTDLKGLRLLLGLSPGDAGALIGETKDWVIGAERGNTWNLHTRYRDFLLSLEGHVQALIEWVDARDFTYLLVYSHDEVFQRMEPEWSAKFPTTMLHLKACARAKAEVERAIYLITFAPSSYEKYLNRDGVIVFPDNAKSRQMWAAAYAKSYRLVDPREVADG